MTSQGSEGTLTQNFARLGREGVIGQAFVALADSLVADYDVIDLLDRLVGYSVQLLAADAAGIMLGDARAELRVVASSSEDADLMELLALQVDEGPCLECFQTSAPVSVANVAEATDRWPAYVDAVAGQGAYSSVHALPLRLRGQAIGVLSLFHRTPGVLPAGDVVLGQALADVATIGILQERAIRRGEVLSEQLQAALSSRVIIEQAKGVLARGGVSMDIAFDRMRQYARRRNERLSEVARKVVAAEVGLDLLLSPVTAPDGAVSTRSDR